MDQAKCAVAKTELHKDPICVINKMTKKKAVIAGLFVARRKNVATGMLDPKSSSTS